MAAVEIHVPILVRLVCNRYNRVVPDDDDSRRVTFVVRDFREPTWPANLGVFDAIVTMQAAHETRHKRHVVPLFERARTLLAPGGLLLYCDGYLHPETKLRALSFDRADQPRALERAGFTDVRLLHDEGNHALYSARARSDMTSHDLKPG